MINAEAMVNVRVAFGGCVKELKDVSKSYKEAKMAAEVGQIFYPEKKVIAYQQLGIGRLIYQLPINLCKMFIDEIFGGEFPEELDEETLMTVDKFFENNLNVSETARHLFVHRNTLVYRMEKLQKAIDEARMFPESGAPVENEYLPYTGIRKKLIGNYILYYLPQMSSKTITVLRILYGKRNIDEIIRQLDF